MGSDGSRHGSLDTGGLGLGWPGYREMESGGGVSKYEGLGSRHIGYRVQRWAIVCLEEVESGESE